MAERGHSRIDLLKYNLGGGEYEVFNPLDLARWRVRILLMGFFHTVPAKHALRVIDAIRSQGFRPVAREGSFFTFVSDKTPWPARGVLSR